MINYEYESLFRQNSIKKSFTITDGDSISLYNSDIYSESISFEESLCSENYLIFGSCNAACLKFTTSDVTDSFKDKRLTVMVALDDNISNPFTFGTYTVAEETLTADRKRKEITAYDDVYVIHSKNVADWYNNIIYPVTLKTFRDSFFAYLDIPQEETTLVNDDMLVEKTIDVQMLSGTEAIKAICEINGVFGHIDRQGIFRYISLSDTSVYSINPSMYTKVEYEDFISQPITQLQIRQEENDIGVIVGVSGNAYIVEDNFLVYGKGTTELTPIANNLLSQIEGIDYKPCKAECIGNPCLEVGDRFTVIKKDNTTFESYLLERKLKGLQALFDTIEAEGVEYYSEDVNGIHYQIQQLKGKSNVLERTIEETRSTISDVEAGLQSEIRQTAEGIEIQISDLQSQIDGETAYFEREGTPTLLNYPYWDFTTNIPCNNTVQTTDDLKFIYTEQNRKDHRSDLCFDTDSNLAYRFVQENGVWFWKEIADSEYTQVLSRLSRLEATAEQLTSEYTEISLDLSSNYFTKVETSSLITQTAGEIRQEVSTNYQTKSGMSDYVTTSVLSQTSSNILGTVSQNYAGKTGGQSSSFSYELTASKFELKANNDTVFTCDSNGITVKGSIVGSTIQGSTIKGGEINGVTIQGSCTMATTSSFLTLYAQESRLSNVTVSGTAHLGNIQFGGSFLRLTSASRAYAFSSRPSMTYSQELRGYVPVFSSYSGINEFFAPQGSISTRFVTT